MAIMIKTPQEIEKMRISGKALREVHNAIAPHVVPGASTMDLEQIAIKKIAELGAVAAFKGYHGYPAALCTSVNDEVVHGIPNPKRILNEGDILSIDCGVIIDGYYSDAAVTYPIGQVASKTARLLEITKASLEKAILQCQVGGRLSDISSAVQKLCEAEGFGVVRD
ncbi:MAG: type I methionyl aminopeptidase, partial [Edaphobacter sp.]